MLIKKTFLLIKLNKNKLHKNQCHFFYAYLKLFHVFPQLIKYEKSKQVPLKSCHISAAAENISKLSVLGLLELHDLPAAVKGKYNLVKQWAESGSNTTLLTPAKI